MKYYYSKIKFLLIIPLFLLVIIPIPTEAGVNSNPGTSLKQSADMAGLENKDINQTVGTFVGQILSMIGVLFFVLVVYGGILWMTARGDTDQTSKAMKTIIAASVGVVLVLSAYAITNFVIGLTDNSSNTSNNPGNNTCGDIAGLSCKNIRNCQNLNNVKNASTSSLRSQCDSDNSGSTDQNKCQTGLCRNQPDDIVCCN